MRYKKFAILHLLSFCQSYVKQTLSITNSIIWLRFLCVSNMETEANIWFGFSLAKNKIDYLPLCVIAIMPTEPLLLLLFFFWFWFCWIKIHITFSFNVTLSNHVVYGAGGVRVGACFNFDGNVSRNFFVVFHEGVFRCSGGFCKGFRYVFGGPKSCSRGWGRAVGCVVK